MIFMKDKMENNIRPFTKEFVLNTTISKMLKSIDISLEKTSGRISEFEGNTEKSTMILQTLSSLYAIRKVVEAIKYD